MTARERAKELYDKTKEALDEDHKQVYEHAVERICAIYKIHDKPKRPQATNAQNSPLKMATTGPHNEVDTNVPTAARASTKSSQRPPLSRSLLRRVKESAPIHLLVKRTNTKSARFQRRQPEPSLFKSYSTTNHRSDRTTNTTSSKRQATSNASTVGAPSSNDPKRPHGLSSSTAHVSMKPTRPLGTPHIAYGNLALRSPASTVDWPSSQTKTIG